MPTTSPNFRPTIRLQKTLEGRLQALQLIIDSTPDDSPGSAKFIMLKAHNHLQEAINFLKELHL